MEAQEEGTENTTADSGVKANNILLRGGVGSSRDGDLASSFGLEYHRFLLDNLGAEVGIHSVHLANFFGDLLGPEEDIDLTEFDLGVRYTLTSIKSSDVAFLPYGALGLAIANVDGKTSTGPVSGRVSDGTDLGAYLRVGANVEFRRNLTLGLDVRTVLGTDDVDYITVGFLVGWSF